MDTNRLDLKKGMLYKNIQKTERDLANRFQKFKNVYSNRDANINTIRDYHIFFEKQKKDILEQINLLNNLTQHLEKIYVIENIKNIKNDLREINDEIEMLKNRLSYLP